MHAIKTELALALQHCPVTDVAGSIVAELKSEGQQCLFLVHSSESLAHTQHLYAATQSARAGIYFLPWSRKNTFSAPADINTQSHSLAKDIRQLQLGQVYSVRKLAWDSKKLVYSRVAPSNRARFIQQICPLSRQFSTFLKKCGPLFLLARVSWLFFLNGNCSLLAEV
jgi:hypothetical protein